MSGMKASLATAVLIAIALVFVTSTIAAPGETTAAPSAVTLVANDFGFDSPDRVAAGLVTITLQNRGSELHHAQLVELKDGRTIDDLMAAFASHSMPDFVSYVGGPGLAAPGAEAKVTLSLKPGTYYWLCFVMTPADHTPHLAKGMVKQLTVEAGARSELPAADNTAMLSDYAFKFGKPLRAGKQTVRVRNYAAQPHEIMLVKLAPGKTADDLVTWLAEGEQGPPPGMPVGGMQALDNGEAGNMELDLEPGSYAAICFVPDAQDMQPHFAHGMVQEFVVE